MDLMTDLREGFDRLHRKIDDDIERVGWSAISVFPDEENPITPFCYSIGFTELGHPELIVYGLNTERMWAVLDDAYIAIRDGHHFTDGEETDRLCQPPYHFAIVSVPGDGHPANMALAHYGEIKLLQAVWPDAEHHYPWQDGWNHDKNRQPVLLFQPDHPDLI